MGPSKKSPKKGSKSRTTGKRSGTRPAKPAAPRRVVEAEQAETETFPVAFARLLRSRKMTVPRGLKEAPPEAYAGQPAALVEQLSGLSDTELKRYADRVAGYVRRREERARREWDASPLIAELRRRKLKEPPCPVIVVGASVSLAKPLTEWSNAEILRAAQDWSRMGR
jgi:hypothetical protein